MRWSPSCEPSYSRERLAPKIRRCRCSASTCLLVLSSNRPEDGLPKVDDIGSTPCCHPCPYLRTYIRIRPGLTVCSRNSMRRQQDASTARIRRGCRSASTSGQCPRPAERPPCRRGCVWCPCSCCSPPAQAPRRSAPPPRGRGRGQCAAWTRRSG